MNQKRPTLSRQEWLKLHDSNSHTENNVDEKTDDLNSDELNVNEVLEINEIEEINLIEEVGNINEIEEISEIEEINKLDEIKQDYEEEKLQNNINAKIMIDDKINIINCSDRVIIIPNLFGIGETLVLGTLDDPSYSSPPYVSVNVNVRDVINNNIYYLKFLNNNILLEVDNITLNKVVSKYYELMDAKESRNNNSSSDVVKMNELNSEVNEKLFISNKKESDFVQLNVNSDIISPDEKLQEDIINII